jgi:heterodisulfide reductase subunit B
MEFSPCIGECTDKGTHCEGCGRSHEDVATMRAMVNNLVAYAQEKNYENIDEYANSVARSIQYKLNNPS